MGVFPMDRFSGRDSFGTAWADATGMPKTGILNRVGNELYDYEKSTDADGFIYAGPGKQGPGLPG